MCPLDTLIEGEIEIGKRYEEKDFNRIIEIKVREAHRVKILLDQIRQNDKTLVSAPRRTTPWLYAISSIR